MLAKPADQGLIAVLRSTRPYYAESTFTLRPRPESEKLLQSFCFQHSASVSSLANARTASVASEYLVSLTDLIIFYYDIQPQWGKNLGLGSHRIAISVNTKCFSDPKNMIYKKIEKIYHVDRKLKFIKVESRKCFRFLKILKVFENFENFRKHCFLNIEHTL